LRAHRKEPSRALQAHGQQPLRFKIFPEFGSPKAFWEAYSRHSTLTERQNLKS
jgi:hypothetical protein